MILAFIIGALMFVIGAGVDAMYRHRIAPFGVLFAAGVTAACGLVTMISVGTYYLWGLP